MNSDVRLYVYAYIAPLLAGVAVGFILGSWFDTKRVSKERDEAVARLEEYVRGNTEKQAEEIARCMSACEDRARDECARRIEALRTSFLQMKCELCK